MKSLITNVLDLPLRNTLSNSNLSEEEMLDVVENMIALNKTLNISKEKDKVYNRTQAAKYLRISDSSFRNKILEGIIPPGIKIVGQGKIWYKKDLDNYLKEYGNKKKTKNPDI